MLENLATVNQWNDTPYEVNPYVNALQASFRTISLFEHLYIPVKTATSTGMPEDFTYVDIGVDRNEMAEIYNTYYGRNRLVEPLIDREVYGYNESVARLNRRILSVYHLNMQKYKKLIELAGYEYNPLWNVDGTEEFSYLENKGTVDATTTYVNAERTDTKGSTTGNPNNPNVRVQKVTTFDSETYRNAVAEEEHETYVTGTHTDTAGTVYTHHNAKNVNDAEYSGGTDTFGNKVVGGDMYHTEKRVRSGNIGVTKTQELIESERLNLRFSILGEFFKDINEEILVGIYF